MKPGLCLKEQKGSVIIIVAVALTAFMAVAALAIDVGLLYQERRQLQTAVDSAALAAAQEMAEGGAVERAQTLAQEYVIKNSQVTPDSISVSFPGPNLVKVDAQTTRKLFFAKAIGRQESSLKATATATYGMATAVRNLVPILVPLQFVSAHIGEVNMGSFEFGSSRPLEVFRKDGIQTGNEILYTITFVNTDSSATGVTITDSVPNNTTYVSGSADRGGNYDGATSIRWCIDSVAAGDYVTVSFKVTVISGSASEIKNTAQAVTDAGRKYNTSTTGAAQKGFFWLSDFDAGSGGTPDYAYWIENGYPKEVGVGHLANGEGVKAALRAALENRLSSDPSVVLPVYDYTERGGSPGMYHVVGFAEFILTSFDLTGSPKTITGYFTDGTVVAGAGGGTPPEADFGIRAVWLVD
jgi:uncharacterized repeat protein (TIGR01451 family)